MELPKEIIDKFKKTNYSTHSIGPRNTGSLCRTELVGEYDKGGHDYYPSMLLYNVLRFKNGQVKKASRSFGDFGGKAEGELIIMIIDWLQQNFDEHEYKALDEV